MITSADDRVERQRRLLAILLLILAAVLVWRFLPSFFDRSRATARAIEQQQALVRGEVVAVDLAALEKPAGRYSPGRNIFEFGRKPAPPPSPPPPPPPPRRRAAPPPPPPPAVRTPPKFNLQLMGIFGPERRRIAVFKDGKEIVNVLASTEIRDKFIVHQINYETVDIAFVGFPDVEPQRIRIGN